jgi:hypothetical protein
VTEAEEPRQQVSTKEENSSHAMHSMQEKGFGFEILIAGHVPVLPTLSFVTFHKVFSHLCALIPV